MSEWINVKDGMPEENMAVIVTWVNHDPPFYYHDMKDTPQVDTAVFFRDKWYWWDSTIEDVLGEYGRADGREMDYAIEVTHWQYMPEPPKEVSE